MPRLKRYFPIPYIVVGSLVIAYGVWKIVEAPAMPWAWFGAVAAIAPFVLFLLSLAVVRRARTARNQVALLVTSVVGTLVSLLSYESPASWLALFLGLVPSLAYVFWYSKLDRSGSIGLSVGATLPELDLVDAEGNPVVPTPGKHVLYMFVRGNWCPLCMAQVKEIASEYRELEARGVEVFVITPQPETKTRALANRFDVPMRFCVDKGNRVARKLGIEHREGVAFGIEALGYDAETVLPTVLITDPQRRLIFADLTDNYRVRPEPSTFLAALDAHA